MFGSIEFCVGSNKFCLDGLFGAQNGLVCVLHNVTIQVLLICTYFIHTGYNPLFKFLFF